MRGEGVGIVVDFRRAEACAKTFMTVFEHIFVARLAKDLCAGL
jgi:hypothetical protein